MIEQQTAPHAAAVTARLATAAAGGVAIGIVTLWLQGQLSGSWNVLANSGAVWTIVAVALAAALGSTAVTSSVAGLLALLGEVAGYYWCAAPWHGVAVTQSEQLLWTAAALVIGPFAGLAGHCIARDSAGRRLLAVLGVLGVLAGEGVYTLRYIPSHHAAALTELAVAIGGASGALFVSQVSWQRKAGALALGLLVALLVLLVYRSPILV